MAQYHLRIIKTNGQVIDGPQKFERLEYAKAVNSPGALTLTMLCDRDDWVDEFPEDTRIMIWRGVDNRAPRLELDAVWFVTRSIVSVGTDRRCRLEVGAKSALDLANRRIIAYAAGAAQATVSGIADNMMKRLITENLGASAGAGRVVTGLTVQANSGLGTVINKQVGWRGLLQTIQEIARDSESAGVTLYYDIVAVSSTEFEFRTWVGQPGALRENPVLSLDSGTLRAASWGFDRDNQTTTIYALGQEYSGTRQVVTATDGSIALTPFSRRENSIEARNATTTAELQAEANAEMQRRRPKDTVVAEVSNSDYAAYGVHWAYGDRLPISVGGKLYQGLVESVQVEVRDSRESIKATLRF